MIAAMTCQDIKVMQTQQVVNAAPTAKEGNGCTGACRRW
jgi:hypothetical protein